MATETHDQLKATRVDDAEKLAVTRVDDAEKLAVSRHQRINLIWEYTQAYIATLVITTVLLTTCYIAVTTKDDGKRTASLLFMTGLANRVAGFYFGRTNHSRPTGEMKNDKS